MIPLSVKYDIEQKCLWSIRIEIVAVFQCQMQSGLVYLYQRTILLLNQKLKEKLSDIDSEISQHCCRPNRAQRFDISDRKAQYCTHSKPVASTSIPQIYLNNNPSLYCPPISFQVFQVEIFQFYSIVVTVLCQHKFLDFTRIIVPSNVGLNSLQSLQGFQKNPSNSETPVTAGEHTSCYSEYLLTFY